MKHLIYFASAHTSAGYRDLLTTNLIGLKHIFFIDGATTQERSDVIRIFIEKWRDYNEELEIILNSMDKNVVSGLINRRLNCAIIDRSVHLSYPIKSLGVTEHLIDLSASFHHEKLHEEREQILALQNQKELSIEKAHQAFKTGLDIHDDLEKIYIEAMDFKKADLIAEELIEQIFQDKTSRLTHPIIRKRFLGASTAGGVVDYIDPLTRSLDKRYLIKGRAGSGKSTMLKKIVAEAEKRNYSLEVYHCGFDPDSLDMVIIRELGVAIFDSTAPHEYEPTRHRDELVELYQTTIEPGTDERFHEDISRLTTQYRYFIQEGTRLLAKALETNQELEQIYHKYLDPDTLGEQIDQLVQKVDAWVK